MTLVFGKIRALTKGPHFSADDAAVSYEDERDARAKPLGGRVSAVKQAYFEALSNPNARTVDSA